MKKKYGFSSAFFLLAVCVLFVIFLAFPEETSSSARKGISVCLETLIPSLFPFFVLSSLTVSLGLSKWIGKLFSRFMSPLFRSSGKTASPFVLGLLSGFPVGASTAVGLYKRGEISRGDCARALSFSNNPSVGFIVSVAGAGILRDIRLGWILYLSVTVASVLSGMVTCRVFHGDNRFLAKEEAVSEETSLLKKFLSAVRDGGTGVLNVSAFVIFFSVLCGVLGSVISLPYPLSAFISGFFEIATGASSVDISLLSLYENTIIMSAILAWSGLSVHSQVLFCVADTDVSPFPYLFSKLVTTLLSALFTAILLLF